MTPVLDNAVATINAYVESFMERHDGLEFAFPMGEYEGQFGTIKSAYYRMEKGGTQYPSRATRYGEHGLMVKLWGEVKDKRGARQQYSMTYNAQDIEGLVL